jgi:hypothetical protein
MPAQCQAALVHPWTHSLQQVRTEATTTARDTSIETTRNPALKPHIGCSSALPAVVSLQRSQCRRQPPYPGTPTLHPENPSNSQGGLLDLHHRAHARPFARLALQPPVRPGLGGVRASALIACLLIEGLCHQAVLRTVTSQ